MKEVKIRPSLNPILDLCEIIYYLFVKGKTKKELEKELKKLKAVN